MIRRSSATLQGLLGVAVLATLLAGCGSTKATGPAPSAVPSATVGTALPSVGPSISPGVSNDVIVPGPPAPSATPEPTFPLQHVDAALEDKLPSTISGVPLVKMSLMLSGYIATTSPAGAGDKALYPAWLAKFGKTPGDVKIAVAVSLSDSVNFQARAIQVPGVSAAALSAGFADVARKAGWPVTNHPNLMSTGKTVLEIINPAVKAAGGVGAGYVYARDGVLYEVITDDQAVLLDALIQLP
jgi:hypothetical protein